MGRRRRQRFIDMSDVNAYHERRARRDRSGWKPGNNGTVSGQPAEVQRGNTGRPDRVDAYWPSGSSDYGHVVSNDGVNVDYLREPGMTHGQFVVDGRQDDPYGDDPWA